MPSLKSLTVVSLILLTRAELPADEWSLSYRNWTYYDDWIIPPSCIDPSTCVKCNSSDETPNSGTIPCLGFNVTNGFTDVFQVWSVSDPYGPSPPSPRFVGAITSVQ